MFTQAGSDRRLPRRSVYALADALPVELCVSKKECSRYPRRFTGASVASFLTYPHAHSSCGGIDFPFLL